MMKTNAGLKIVPGYDSMFLQKMNIVKFEYCYNLNALIIQYFIELRFLTNDVALSWCLYL